LLVDVSEIVTIMIDGTYAHVRFKTTAAIFPTPSDAKCIQEYLEEYEQAMHATWATPRDGTYTGWKPNTAGSVTITTGPDNPR